MALTEAQIIDLLNDPSNDDFYRYATDLKNRLDSERGFAIELNKKLPDVDTTSHHRIYKIVENFCKEYKTKHDAASPPSPSPSTTTSAGCLNMPCIDIMYHVLGSWPL